MAVKYRSISVKDVLWRELKARAAKEGLSINRLIEGLLCTPEPPDPDELPGPPSPYKERLQEAMEGAPPFHGIDRGVSDYPEHAPTCKCSMCR